MKSAPGPKVASLEVLKGRSPWWYVVVGFLINVCGGTVYAYSIFRKPLQDLWGLSATASGLPFMVFLAVFAGAMAVAGAFLDRWGPRRTALLGSALVGLGWVLAGLSPNIAVLTLTYGLVAGAGMGFLYGCPIAVAARWFPERRGLAVGLTVVGFGISPLLTAPLVGAFIGAVGPLRAFLYLGILFSLVLLALSATLTFPPAKWSAVNAKNSPGNSWATLAPSDMLRTPAFYALWGTFALGCLVGLMAVGIAAPFGQEVAKVNPALATQAVSAFALFNGAGRPLFGWLADRLTPRSAALLSFVLVFFSATGLWLWGEGNAIVYFLGFGLLWFNLGGWLAIAPTATARFFGMKHYGKNYGIVYTAYGAGAILGNILSGVVRDLTGTYLAIFPWVMALAAFGLGVAFVGLRPLRRSAPLGTSGA